jgi:hypothetical protein
MKSTTQILLVAAVFTLASCRDSSNLSKQQQQYDVVQEGVAGSGSNAALTAGGTVPPMTGTAADTTTDFQLPVATGTATPQPGTIAGTLPPPNIGTNVTPGYQPPPQPGYTPAAAQPQRTASTDRSQPAPVRRDPAPAPRPEPTLSGGFTSGSSRPPVTTTTTTQAPQPPAEAPEEAAEPEEAEEPEAAEPAEPQPTETAPPPPGDDESREG